MPKAHTLFMNAAYFFLLNAAYKAPVIRLNKPVSPHLGHPSPQDTSTHTVEGLLTDAR